MSPSPPPLQQQSTHEHTRTHHERGRELGSEGKRVSSTTGLVRAQTGGRHKGGAKVHAACLAAPSPTHTRTPTHPHTAGAGRVRDQRQLGPADARPTAPRLVPEKCPSLFSSPVGSSSWPGMRARAPSSVCVRERVSEREGERGNTHTNTHTHKDTKPRSIGSQGPKRPTCCCTACSRRAQATCSMASR